MLLYIGVILLIVFAIIAFLFIIVSFFKNGETNGHSTRYNPDPDATKIRAGNSHHHEILDTEICKY